MNTSRLISNTAIVLGVKGISAALSFLIGILCTYKFNLEVTAEYYVALSVILIGSTISRLGLVNFILNKFSGLRSINREIPYLFSLTSSAFLVSLVISVLLCILLFIPFFDKYKLSITAGLLSIPFHAVCFCFCAYLQSKLKFVYSNLLQNFVSYLITVFIILMSKDSNWILFSIPIGYSISCLFAYILITKNLQVGSRFPIKLLSLNSLIRKTKSFLITDLAVVSTNWLPILLSSIFLNKDDTGVLSLILKLSWLISFMLISANSVFAPVISKLYKKNEMEALKSTYRKVTIGLAVITLPAIVFVVLVINYFSKDFNILVYEYRELFYISILTQYLIVILGPVYFLMLMTNLSSMSANIMIHSVLLGNAVFFTLIYFYGITGAVIAFSLMCILPRIAMSIVCFKKFRVFSFINYG